MARFLKRFHGSIRICSTGLPASGSTLLKGTILAVDSGWKGAAMLDVLNSDVGDEDCARLAVYLPQFPHLHTINFAGNNITGDGVFALSCALRSASSLTALDLSRNTFGASGATCLAAQLRKCEALRALRVAGCGLPQASVAAICQGLPPNLEELDLSHNVLDDYAAEALAEALPCLLNLRALFFSAAPEGTGLPPPHQPPLTGGSDRMSHAGAAMLARGLLNCKHLHQLHLAHHKIGAPGAGLVFASLSAPVQPFAGEGAAARRLPTIEHLDLSHCGLSCVPQKAWTQLACLAAIRSLQLSGNALDTEDLFGLARVLPALTSLTSLNLRQIAMSEEGRRAILSASSLPNFAGSVHCDGGMAESDT